MAVALSRCGGMTGGSSAEVFSDSAPVILKEYRSRLFGRHGVVTTPCLRVYHSGNRRRAGCSLSASLLRRPRRSGLCCCAAELYFYLDLILSMRDCPSPPHDA